MPERTAVAAWVVAGLLLAIVAGTTLFGLFRPATERPPDRPLEPANEEVAGADLKLYRAVVQRVRAGENYYDVAREELPRRGFFTSSTFNFRLPTYAYLFALLPGPEWIQGCLILLGAAALLLTCAAEKQALHLLAVPGTFLLQFGVFAWCLDGEAYFAQEVWAALLLLLSVAAGQLRWPSLAVGAGLAALFFRELVLPYCLLAAALSWWHGRRREAMAWTVGLALWFVFLAWHMQQASSRLSAADRASSGGLADWFVFGGLWFDLLATRMNAFLFEAPTWIVLAYLLTALVGLGGWRTEHGALVGLTALTYLAAFSMVGMPKNLNWGLMFAPLLPFGVVRAPGVVAGWVQALRKRAVAEVPPGKLQ